MPSQYDIEYAMENTQVLHEPDRRIDTFGTTASSSSSSPS